MVRRGSGGGRDRMVMYAVVGSKWKVYPLTPPSLAPVPLHGRSLRRHRSRRQEFGEVLGEP